MTVAESFRQFEVFQKVRENDIITSFYLRPVDGGALASFRPGQYLTFRLPGPDGPIIRTYSLSGAEGERSYYRITVKREAAPPGRPDLPVGLGSNYLHDRVEVGDRLDVAAPRGAFVLNEASSRPVLLLSGGVGLTPLVSMLHSLVRTGRRGYFFHACENGPSHALRTEVDRLCRLSGGRFKRRFFYRAPTAADVAARQFDREGLVTADELRPQVDTGACDVYLCGPPAFMEAMYDALTALGVAEDRISYEFFGPATVLKRVPKSPNVRSRASDGPSVEFARSGKTAAWIDDAESLLELAELSDLNPNYSCRNGVCGTCKCDLLQGEVEYFQEPLEEPEPGKVLICCSKPLSNVVLGL